MENYLVGLLESKLHIHFGSKNKMEGHFSHNSLKILYEIQFKFGGKIHKEKRYNILKLIFYNNEVISMCEMLIHSATKRKKLYDLILEFQKFKTQGIQFNRNTQKEKLKEYRLKSISFKAEIKKIQKELKENSLSVDKEYEKGFQNGINYKLTENQDQFLNQLIWSKNIEEINKENIAKKNAKMAARIEAKIKKKQDKIDLKVKQKFEKRKLLEEKWAIQTAAADKKKREEKQLRDAAREKRIIEKEEFKQKLFNEGNKHCNLCNTIKPLIEFYKDSGKKEGVGRYCKKCVIEKHVTPHRKEITARIKLYQKLNPEKVRASRTKDKNKPHNKIMAGIKRRIGEYLKSNSIRAKSIIGCSPKELIEYITKQFTVEMNWNNYGKIWEIDHIIPCAAFDSNKKQHLQWCWNYKNLRPLLRKNNGNKSDYISGESVRTFKSNGQIDKLNNIVGQELEKLGITTKEEFLKSLNSQNTIIILK